MWRNVDLIYFDAGGGHRAAAIALAEAVRRRRLPWDVRMLNMQEMLSPIDFIRKSTGIPFADVYNLMLRRRWTLGSKQLIPAMHGVIRMFHKGQVRVTKRYWGERRPDLVVSLIPHYNRALRQSLDLVAPGTPYVTILTDIADYPPHFWIERMDQHVICGSGRAVEQARQLGLPESRILRTSGMIVNPRFYEPPAIDRESERVRLGLQPDLPTGLVLFGGEGSIEMVKIAAALNASPCGVQLILLCGHHQEAARQLREMPQRIPMAVEGFTREIPYFMALSDFFIGKPGPGSISEALVMRLPAIVEKNAWTLAHERYNADWIEEQGVGIVVSSFSKVAGAVRQMLEPERFQRYRERAAATRNEAIHEIPELLDEIMTRHWSGRFAVVPGADGRALPLV